MKKFILLLMCCLPFSGFSFTLDFSKASGNPVEWLEKQGFKFQKDASEIKLSINDKKLVLESEDPILGVIIKEGLNEKFSKVKIEWGVLEYPKGASYEAGVNNEILMVYIFFGTEKLPSGNVFIPDSPYFLGLFLGEKDVPGKAYIGRHFKKGGRFVCVGKPKAGETVTTVFDLDKNFKDCFNKKNVPSISGISLEVDTSYLKSGKGKAFIKKIEFLKK